MSAAEDWIAKATEDARRLRIEERTLSTIDENDPVKPSLEASVEDLMIRMKGVTAVFAAAKEDLGYAASAVEAHVVYGIPWDAAASLAGMTRKGVFRLRRKFVDWLDAALASGGRAEESGGHDGGAV